ncbi:mercury methylation ferredoxin HgcB [Treponema sp. J25]|uniref:mercury methylation ferredoxin HgcB n=1 Tax=Treponema sp. J25 TaxID=2094121 RepID=UPI0010524CF4|nr:mercury methylation ferredoxin HgcB [Treponema sp. J25]TCW61872.1 ferredoxin [Treponema sp. J25]
MEFRYILAGQSLTLDTEKCIGCLMCCEVCPHNVFSFAEGKARIADRGRCMECGACARNCPVSALTVTSGVGCTAAVIGGLLKGGEPNCDCDCGTAKSKKVRCC